MPVHRNVPESGTDSGVSDETTQVEEAERVGGRTYPINEGLNRWEIDRDLEGLKPGQSFLYRFADLEVEATRVGDDAFQVTSGSRNLGEFDRIEAVAVVAEQRHEAKKVSPEIQKGLDYWSASWLAAVPRDGQWRTLATFTHYSGLTPQQAQTGKGLADHLTHKSLRFGDCFGLRWEVSGVAAPKRGGVMLDADWSRPIVTKTKAGCQRIDRYDQCEFRVLAASPDFIEWTERRKSVDGTVSYVTRRWEREGLRIVDNIGKALVRRGRPDVAWGEESGRVLWTKDARRPGRGLELVDIEKERQDRREVTVLKRDDEQRYTLGLVYKASRQGERKDAHGDWMSPDELERAAWSYMARSRRVGMMHEDGTDGSGDAVESYIYRGPNWSIGDTIVEAGDWLMGTIWSRATWDRIKAGDLTGYSLQGMASRIADDA